MEDHRIRLLQNLSKTLGISILEVFAYPVLGRGFKKEYYWKIIVSTDDATETILLTPKQMQTSQIFRMAFVAKALILPRKLPPPEWRVVLRKFLEVSQKEIYANWKQDSLNQRRADL